MLTPLAPNVWHYNAPMTVLRMPLGHRMTVAQLPDGDLWVHSPVEYSDALAAELKVLGRIGHIVAPNYMHDTYLEGWIPRYPEARFHAPRAFHKVFPQHKTTDVLNDTPPAAWEPVFSQHVMAGVPSLHETVFLHRASRTLIIADLAFNLQGDFSFLGRTLLKLNGCYHCFTPSRMLKSVIKDRAALARSIDHVLSWDFDRIIVSHGENIPAGGKDALRLAFGFLR